LELCNSLIPNVLPGQPWSVGENRIQGVSLGFARQLSYQTKIIWSQYHHFICA